MVDLSSYVNVYQRLRYLKFHWFNPPVLLVKPLYIKIIQNSSPLILVEYWLVGIATPYVTVYDN